MLARWLYQLQTTFLPSRARKMYFALGEISSASAGRCVFKKRRWVCASRFAIISPNGMVRMSTQGEISSVASFSAPSNISCDTICCVQVVPDLAHVAMTMSPSRNLKRSQRVESISMLCNSRVFFGYVAAVPGMSVNSCIHVLYLGKLRSALPRSSASRIPLSNSATLFLLLLNLGKKAYICCQGRAS